jgi:thioredoxin-related protein
LENNLEALSRTYDVIALAHSDVKPTMEWVKNNLKGTLKIGFSTKELRDKLQVVGQPITLIFDTSGEIISRDFGYIPTN